jgi:hypothetical protein
MLLHASGRVRLPTASRSSATLGLATLAIAGCTTGSVCPRCPTPKQWAFYSLLPYAKRPTAFLESSKDFIDASKGWSICRSI